jgi:hypothetical protein
MTAKTAIVSKGVKRMFGLSLHGWENWMIGSLIFAGAAALVVGLSTWAVVRLQRIEIAQLEDDAAKARLETERIKSIVAWRVISPDIGSKMEEVLSKKPGSVNLRYTDGDPEALYLAIQFSNLLAKAKWQVAPGSLKLGNAIVFGISLPDSTGADAQTLRDALTTAQVPFSPNPMPNTGSSAAFNVSTISGAPTLMIGSRPPPQLP